MKTVLLSAMSDFTVDQIELLGTRLKQLLTLLADIPFEISLKNLKAGLTYEQIGKLLKLTGSETLVVIELALTAGLVEEHIYKGKGKDIGEIFYALPHIELSSSRTK